MASASSAGVTETPDPVGFEELLGDLSTTFIRATIEEIDGEIQRWIQQIVLAMQVDRGVVMQLKPADGALYVTHQWARNGMIVPDMGLKVSSSQAVPWLAAKILAGELVVVSRL